MNTIKSIIASSVLMASFGAMAENVVIDGKTYQLDRLIERQIGPGTTYMRLRLPEIPLNVNMVMVDMTNEYVGIENSVAKESSKGVEAIATAATRLSTDGHKAIAGQNANFWAVTSQAPDGKMFSSVTRNISIRNGKIVTECNMGASMAFGGPVSVTGLMGVSPDGEIFIDYCQPSVAMRINDGIALYTIAQCNKGVHPDEIGMYNSFYGTSKAFVPIAATNGSDGYYQTAPAGDAIEVLLDINEGQKWMGGQFIEFTVKEVRADAGTGTLGNHDLALVGRGNGRIKLANIKAGDKVALKYAFKFSPAGDAEYPLVETAIGGNLLTMRGGEVSSYCNTSDYDRTTYPRSLYGTSADRKTLYMMVIDKSTDPVYGKSAGLNTAKASQIARHFGCTNMMQCDGGGSAELYVTNGIVNKTTESTPRAVANCLMVFDNAPADNTLSELRIDTPEEVIQVPLGGSLTPTVLFYNKYGSLIKTTTGGYTLTCSDGLGKITGTTLTASSTPVFGYITVAYQGVSTRHAVSVGGAVSGISDVKANEIADSRIYNLMGVEVEGDLAPGVYVSGGKKIVVK